MVRRMLCLKGLGKQRKSSRNVSNPVYRDEQLYLLDIYRVIYSTLTVLAASCRRSHPSASGRRQRYLRTCSRSQGLPCPPLAGKDPAPHCLPQSSSWTHACE